jgi:hypothetical protein
MGVSTSSSGGGDGGGECFQPGYRQEQLLQPFVTPVRLRPPSPETRAPKSVSLGLPVTRPPSLRDILNRADAIIPLARALRDSFDSNQMALDAVDDIPAKWRFFLLVFLLTEGHSDAAARALARITESAPISGAHAELLRFFRPAVSPPPTRRKGGSLISTALLEHLVRSNKAVLYSLAESAFRDHAIGVQMALGTRFVASRQDLENVRGSVFDAPIIGIHARYTADPEGAPPHLELIAAGQYTNLPDLVLDAELGAGANGRAYRLFDSASRGALPPLVVKAARERLVYTGTNHRRRGGLLALACADLGVMLNCNRIHMAFVHRRAATKFETNTPAAWYRVRSFSDDRVEDSMRARAINLSDTAVAAAAEGALASENAVMETRVTLQDWLGERNFRDPHSDLFEAIDGAVAIGHICLQVILAATAFHRLTGCLHADLSFHNVVRRRELGSLPRDARVRGKRYLFCPTVIVSDETADNNAYSAALDPETLRDILEAQQARQAADDIEEDRLMQPLLGARGPPPPLPPLPLPLTRRRRRRRKESGSAVQETTPTSQPLLDMWLPTRTPQSGLSIEISLIDFDEAATMAAPAGGGFDRKRQPATTHVDWLAEVMVDSVLVAQNPSLATAARPHFENRPLIEHLTAVLDNGADTTAFYNDPGAFITSLPADDVNALFENIFSAEIAAGRPTAGREGIFVWVLYRDEAGVGLERLWGMPIACLDMIPFVVHLTTLAVAAVAESAYDTETAERLRSVAKRLFETLGGFFLFAIRPVLQAFVAAFDAERSNIVRYNASLDSGALANLYKSVAGALEADWTTRRDDGQIWKGEDALVYELARFLYKPPPPQPPPQQPDKDGAVLWEQVDIRDTGGTVRDLLDDHYNNMLGDSYSLTNAGDDAAVAAAEAIGTEAMIKSRLRRGQWHHKARVAPQREHLARAMACPASAWETRGAAAAAAAAAVAIARVEDGFTFSRLSISDGKNTLD